METLGWNPLTDERSHASSLMFPGFAATVNSTTTTRSGHQSKRHAPRQPPQSANYPHRNQVKFSFNFSEFADDDMSLPLTSPAISVSPGVFFDGDAFNFPPSSANQSDQSQERSPSLGLGSSLGTDLASEDAPGCWRPSSVAHFSFPKNGNDLPYDLARAKSAVPTFHRPDSSADYRENDVESPVEGDECSEHWTDWNIRTAVGCPPLDQLFENKRRWREKFNQSVPPPLQRYCVFCKSISKPSSIYMSHAIRDAKGEITCPVLNAYNCPKCGKRGHTIRYCALNQQSSSSNNSSPLPIAMATSVLSNSSHGSSNFLPSTRLGSVGSFSEAMTYMGGNSRSTKSSLGFY